WRGGLEPARQRPCRPPPARRPGWPRVAGRAGRKTGWRLARKRARPPTPHAPAPPIRRRQPRGGEKERRVGSQNFALYKTDEFPHWHVPFPLELVYPVPPSFVRSWTARKSCPFGHVTPPLSNGETR